MKCTYFEEFPFERYHLHGSGLDERVHWNPNQSIPNVHNFASCPICKVEFCTHCNEPKVKGCQAKMPAPVAEWTQKQIVFVTRVAEAAIIGVIVGLILSYIKR